MTVVEGLRVKLLQEVADYWLTARVLKLLGGVVEADDGDLGLEAGLTALDMMSLINLPDPDGPDVGVFDDRLAHRTMVGRLVERLVDRGDVRGALEVADRSRGRSSQTDFYGPARGDEPGPLPPQSDATPLADLIRALRVAATDALSVAGYRPAPSWKQLTDTVRGHRRRAVLLHPGPTRLVRFVVDPTGQVQVSTRPVSAKQVADLAAALRDELTTHIGDMRGPRALETEDEVLAALAAWGALWDAAEADTWPGKGLSALLDLWHDLVWGGLPSPDDDPIVVVPYREMTLLPLAALAPEEGEPQLQHRSISLAVSLGSLKSQVAGASGAPPTAGTTRALVVGDPVTHPKHQLSPLLGAAREAERVAQRLRARAIDTQVLAGVSATESAVGEGLWGARLVHFACHARPARKATDSAALFLSPGSTQSDGVLHTHEVERELPLDDALVVLAACETGVGPATPDGVAGLGKAFHRLGARTVVLSLWQVGDTVTFNLMDHFYRALLEGQQAADALVTAQRLVRGVTPDLAAYGGWVVVGDGSWTL